MWLQLLLIFIAFVVLQVIQDKETPIKKHKYIVFITVMLILQSGLRHLAVGSDTYSYFMNFEEIRHASWQSIFQDIYSSLFEDGIKDPGYRLFEKCFITILPSYRLFLFFVAIVFFVPFCRVAERNLSCCRQVFLFFCIYQTIFYDFFSITGLRQTLATIAILLGVGYIQENKLVKFILVTLIASLIHNSVLLILPFYFIAKIPKSKYVLLAVILSLPYFIVTARYWAVLLGNISGKERYLAYANSTYETEGAQNFLLFIAAGCLLILVAKWRNPGSISDILVNACALGLLFAPLTWVDPSLMRVGQYFSLFALIAIPKAIDNLGTNKQLSNAIYIVMFVLLIATIIRHNAPYAFFWDYMQLGENYR